MEWRLVDGVFPRSRFQNAVRERALSVAEAEAASRGQGIALEALAPRVFEDRVEYRHVTLALGHAARTAVLTVNGATDAAGFLRAFRELDDALLRLRFHYEEIGLVLLKTRGDLEAARALDATLYHQRAEWPVSEILLLAARTLRRLDLTARSFFAVVDRGSCFAGSLLELALAADRTYMLDADDVHVATSPLNAGLLPMLHGPSRLAARNLPVEDLVAESTPFDAPAASGAGLATVTPDEIDWEDELRVAGEERVSLSPDALTGMEASLRFPGPENAESKIFARLSAWQNWVFSRPNATGEHGALSLYGKPERPHFDWRRT